MNIKFLRFPRHTETKGISEAQLAWRQFPTQTEKFPEHQLILSEIYEKIL